MPLATLGSLQPVPALDRPDLLAPPVAEALRGWSRAGEVGVVEIDPDLADTAALAEAYALPMDTGANCVVVAGRRAGTSGSPPAWSAPTPAPTSTTWSSAPSTSARRRSSPTSGRSRRPGWSTAGSRRSGCRQGWRVLVDTRCLGIEVAVIGSGVRRSKLLVTGRLLGALPGAEVVEGLAV